MKLKPLRDRVLVERDTKSEKLSEASLLYRPEVIKKDPEMTGTVMAVGPGLTTANGTFIPNVLKEGQKVVFPKHCGTEAKFLGDNFFVVREDEILGILEQ
jgi:chaperonin GroES